MSWECFSPLHTQQVLRNAAKFPPVKHGRHRRVQRKVLFTNSDPASTAVCTHTHIHTHTSDLGRKVCLQVTPKQSILQILVPRLRPLLEEGLSFSSCNRHFQVCSHLLLLQADLLALPCRCAESSTTAGLAPVPAVTQPAGSTSSAQSQSKHDCKASARHPNSYHLHCIMFSPNAVILFLKMNPLFSSLGEELFSSCC